MNQLKIEDLEIKASEAGGLVTVKWMGRSESRNPSEHINPFFDVLLGSVKGKNLEIDFCSLQYMNSSTVPPIIRLVKSCSENQIPTIVYYNKDSEWQSASFKPLKVVCTTLKNVKVEGK